MALFPLGTVHPTKDAWMSINLSSDFSGAVLAFQTFNGEGFDSVFSWVLVRRVWSLAGSKLHEKPSRVFPSENDFLLPLTYPISSLLLDSGGSSLEFLKRYRRLPFPHTEPDWFVTVSGAG